MCLVSQISMTVRVLIFFNLVLFEKNNEFFFCSIIRCLCFRARGLKPAVQEKSKTTPGVRSNRARTS